MSTKLYLLGVPHFERDGQSVDLTSAKAIALLAYLALSQTAQPRDRILALLWAESFDEAARKNLRNTLWTTRKALGDVVQAETDRVALDSSVWADVREFEKLAEAAPDAIMANPQAFYDLYRGPFLDGLSLTEAPDFELWIERTRERLEQLYLRALSGVADAYKVVGNWQEVAATAHRALTHDDLYEPMVRTLMEAHARLGERSEALRHYDSFRATLSRELKVEPMAETEALHTAIMNGNFQAAPPVTINPIRRGRSKGQPSVPYVGRQMERAVLDAEVHLASDGQARIVLLVGEVGIGKSRLWEEWSANLPADVVILHARCIEATRSLPYAPLTEFFASQICGQRLFTATSPVSPALLAEVARLVPEIRDRVPNLPAPAILPPEDERRRIFEAFAQSILAFKSCPLVFFIDDLHWADHATLDWLGYLAHRARNEPFLLIGAYRPEDAPPELVHLVAGWGREGISRRLVLSHLSDDDSASLIESMGGDPAVMERIQTQSGGNPYFLIELVRAGGGDVPPALSELVRTRLDRLPDDARQLLQAAAVLEPDFDFPALRDASGRSEEEALNALDTLLNAGVLVERGQEYAFAHPLIATIVRNGLSGARRAFLNRRAAEALEKIYATRLPYVAGRLATHYAQAGDPAKAADYAQMTAERALTVAAPDEALEFYRQALTLDPTPARQMGLGKVLYRLGALETARDTFKAALSGFEAQKDFKGAVRACLLLAETYVAVGRADEIRFWVEKGLNYLDEKADPEAHALAHFLIGAGLNVTEQSSDDAEKNLAEAIQLAMDHHLPGVAARSRFELGNLLAQRGDLKGAVQAFKETIDSARSVSDPFQEVLGHNNAAYHSLLLGDLATAKEEAQAGLALAEGSGIRIPLQYLYSTRGEIALAEQHWDEAQSWFELGLSEAEYNQNDKQAANYLANLSLAARGRGDLDSALLYLDTARQEASRLTAPHLQTQIDLWLTELYLERGERAAAHDALARAQAKTANSHYKRLQAWAERLVAEFGKK